MCHTLNPNCSLIVCDPLKCDPGYTPIVSPGQCCPSCQPDTISQNCTKILCPARLNCAPDESPVLLKDRCCPVCWRKEPNPTPAPHCREKRCPNIECKRNQMRTLLQGRCCHVCRDCSEVKRECPLPYCYNSEMTTPRESAARPAFHALKSLVPK